MSVTEIGLCVDSGSHKLDVFLESFDLLGVGDGGGEDVREGER